MNPVFINVISYTTIIFVSLFLFNFLSSGFLMAFIKTKAGRGKRSLLFVEGRSGNYFKVGDIKEDELYYKNREGVKKILTIKEGQVRRIMNIPFMQIDDVKNAIQNPDFTTASGHDAANVDNLLTRALMAPSTMLEKFVKIILIITIVLVLLSIVIGFLVFKVNSGMPSISSNSATAAQQCTAIAKHLNITNIIWRWNKMKWERYNQLGSQDKEEYNFRFTRVIDVLFDLELMTFILTILVIQVYQLTKQFFLLNTLNYFLFGIWLIISATIFKAYQKYKWLKNKGV